MKEKNRDISSKEWNEKLHSKHRHVSEVGKILYWVIDELRDRASKHDADKLIALKEHKTVDTTAHHQLRHHWLNNTSNIQDVDIVDVIEFIADNVASAKLESPNHELSDPSSASKIKLANIGKVLMNTAKHYDQDVNWKMVPGDHIWDD